MNNHINQSRVIGDKCATKLFPLKKLDGRFLAGKNVDLARNVGIIRKPC